MGIRSYCKSKILNSSYRYITTLISSYRYKTAQKRYFKQQVNGTVDFRDETIKRVKDAISIISSKEYSNKDYIIFHNPKWLGVTASTKELFENLVPLQELYVEKDIFNIASVIASQNISQVIFSSFVDGWEKLAKKLKEIKPDIKLKCFWHGSNSQVIENINWRTNTNVINLHKEGIIDVFATCKESILNFYKSQGYKTCLVKNTVRIPADIKENFKNTNYYNINEFKNLKIGLYAAGNDWRKNMFNQIAVSTLFENAVIESIPINYEGNIFAKNNNVNLVGSNSTISREDILKKFAKNDINLYITFSECAPMVPIESMEMGTLCLSGNNHHYFKDTKLREYLVVDREDDVMCIYKKIKYALENREEIFKIYEEWKKEYDKKSIQSVQEFLNM